RINVGIRRRLAPLLDNNRRRIELLNCLLFSLPGTPILYYGDEIGMGDNYYLGDRDGVRTPMQWSPDRNAGFSEANPQRLYLPVIVDSEYHYSTVNVENQSRNLSSLFWFMRRTLGVRKQFQAFGRGAIEFLRSDNPSVLTFVRTFEEEAVLVVANLSRHGQAVTVQMPHYAGFRVVDIFSDNEFPSVTEAPYTLTMAPHSFYWFSLEKSAEPVISESDEAMHVHCSVAWSRVIGSPVEKQLLTVIRSYLSRARWFGGKARTIRRLEIADSMALPTGDGLVHMVRLAVHYAKGGRELYLLPLGFATGEEQAEVLRDHPQGVIAYLQTRDHEGILFDAVYHHHFHDALLDAVAQKRNRRLGDARLVGRRGAQFAQLAAAPGAQAQSAASGAQPASTGPADLTSRVLKVEQSNSSVLFGSSFFLKLYRRLEEGINPDVELSRGLTEQAGFDGIPAYAGALEWHGADQGVTTIGLLQQFVPNETDAWTWTLNNVERSFGDAQTHQQDTMPRLPASIYTVDPEALPDEVRDFIGTVYVEMVTKLGRRTAQMHRGLAALTESADQRPEPFSLLYQKSLHQGIRGAVLKTLDDLEGALGSLDEQTAAPVRSVLGKRRQILARLKRISDRKVSALKMRTHGDYHLGQVLSTGKDFVIIDFEGEPARSITERRLKQSALRDVAGMIRSFHYAAHGAIFLRAVKQGADADYLTGWADLWYRSVSGIFLHAYRAEAGTGRFIPADDEDFAILLETFLLEKAVYELAYEMNNRPDWLIIPARGLESLLADG
ncbi:MAG: alpha-amylase, partial [Spirochaetaceae bacterium]